MAPAKSKRKPSRANKSKVKRKASPKPKPIMNKVVNLKPAPVGKSMPIWTKVLVGLLILGLVGMLGWIAVAALGGTKTKKYSTVIVLPTDGCIPAAMAEETPGGVTALTTTPQSFLDYLDNKAENDGIVWINRPNTTADAPFISTSSVWDLSTIDLVQELSDALFKGLEDKDNVTMTGELFEGVRYFAFARLSSDYFGSTTDIVTYDPEELSIYITVSKNFKFQPHPALCNPGAGGSVGTGTPTPSTPGGPSSQLFPWRA